MNFLSIGGTTALKSSIKNNNNISVVSYKKNVEHAPTYANIIENRNNNGFTYQPNDRYSIEWFNGTDNLFSTIEPIIENKVRFENTSMFGGYVRIFTNSLKSDEINEAFTYIYYKLTKELYCLALIAHELRFGGIAICPDINNILVKKFERHEFLMNKFKRLVPLIGKWALFFNQLYTEVTYRPHNLGAIKTLKRLNNYESMTFT